MTTTMSYNSTLDEEELKRDLVIKNDSFAFDDVTDVDLCKNEEMPDFKSYLEAIDIFGCALIAIAGLFIMVIMFMYLDTLRCILKNTTSRAKTPTSIIISVYPVVAIVTFCAILIPRAHLLAETAAQAMFMCAMYHLFCMFIAYCGGEAELIRKAGSETLELKAQPCCCWPCCVILPRLEVSKRNLRILRLMVLQLPVVHGIFYLFLLVVWAEYQNPYQVNVAYIQPITLTSIFTGIWALTILINIMQKVLTQQGYALNGKFIALQLVPISAQLLGLITRVLVMADVLPCNPPITPTVFGSLLYNSLLITEMMVLSVWTRTLYKRRLPDNDSAGIQKQSSPQQDKQCVC